MAGISAGLLAYFKQSQRYQGKWKSDLSNRNASFIELNTLQISATVEAIYVRTEKIDTKPLKIVFSWEEAALHSRAITARLHYKLVSQLGKKFTCATLPSYMY